MMINVRNKKKRAFSLVETMATILIYAVMLLMITNIVLTNARLNQQLKMRSRIRSELSQTVALIKRDVRNATNIDTANCTAAKCVLTIVNNQITWQFSAANNTITRTDGATGEVYTTADFIYIESLNFYTITEASTLSKQATIILTLKAKGVKDVWKVNNQVVQEIISTRNYGISI